MVGDYVDLFGKQWWFVNKFLVFSVVNDSSNWCSEISNWVVRQLLTHHMDYFHGCKMNLNIIKTVWPIVCKIVLADIFFFFFF